MAAILEQCQRRREDGRKAKKRKRSCSKNSVCWCLASLLFVLPVAASVAVEGLKGGNVTLPCSLSSRENLSTVLTFGHTKAYGVSQDEHFRGRMYKSGSCDLILQDLKTTDAGKYTADVYDKSGLISSDSYDVCVNVSLTGRKGEPLMFDELPREAESVDHLTDPDWTEVWRKERGVLTDRLTNKNGCLTIKSFSSSDAGIYRVLNSSGGILLTVTVTESGSESKDKQDSTHEDENHDTVRVHDGVGIGIGLVALAALIVFAVMMARWCRNRNKKHDSYEEVQMKETV